MPILDQDLKNRTDTGKASVANAVEEKFKLAAEAKRQWEKQAYKNIAFLLGYQWLDWQDGSGLVEHAVAPGERYHLVHNLIQPAVRTAVSRITAHRPWVTALPVTNEQEDINAARLGTKLLQHWRRKLFSQSKMVDYATWLVVIGKAFWRVGWDAHAGRSLTQRPLAPAPEGLVSADGAGQGPNASRRRREGTASFDRYLESLLAAEGPAGGSYRGAELPAEPLQEVIAEGDVLLEVVSPFEIYPEPNSRSWDQANWIIHARLRSREDVETIWGKKVSANATSSGHNDADSIGFDPERIPRSGEPFNLDSIFGGSPISNEEDEILVLEYWERPSKRWPSGRRVVVVGGVLVGDGDNPFPFNDIPFASSDYEKIPGAFWGRGIVESVIPAQQEYNKGLSALAESRDYTAHAKILMPRGAQISEAVGDNIPGEVWEYSGAIPPTILNPPAMPAHMGASLQHSRQVIMDITHQHEVTQGTTPPNVEYGIAIQLLHEADNSPLRSTYDMFDDAIARVGLMLLQIAQKYYTEIRTIRLVGEDKQHQVLAFTGSDIRGINDIIVEPRSAIPDTLVAKRQEAVNLFNMGIFGPPGDPMTSARFLKYYEMGHLTELFEENETLDEMLLNMLRRAMSGDPAAMQEISNVIALLQSIGGPQAGGGPPQPQGAGPSAPQGGELIPGMMPVGV